MPPHQAYKQHSNFILSRMELITKMTKLKATELLVILAYPFTILLGQLLIICLSFEGEGTRLENYFMDKRNLINQIFVKKGWFWTILLMTYFNVQYLQAKRDIRQSFLRMAVSTIWWYCFTQAFFGLPIMDRVFLLTGGSCLQDSSKSSLGILTSSIGSHVCRKVKGEWIGGHDPSGHVFLLVHSSILLWFDVLELEVGEELLAFWNSFSQRKSVWNRTKAVLSNSLILLLSLILLWWWMLLITSIHFHSFAEKITGLVAGVSAVILYLIPRFLS
ncbi:hypothetical protein WICPIJ_008820 [Wickerhamomyces pijperi]|uniref:Acyl-coenzyme A diphosphatase SCS3 n=1 Tax=Wickerhamomyces pijperi TaxID=599730 RepID=A0A9P8PWG0_WICPI|nr:hypothetical protein WICPIJ_008820 [Wickerhamomyces pijperi]